MTTLPDHYYRPSTPSPYCGRIDPHDEHPWKGVNGEHICPGPPTGTAPYQKP